MTRHIANKPRLDVTLMRLQRRLDRWELPHLRRHAASLAARLTETEHRLIDTEAGLRHAEDVAESWREDALNLQQHAFDGTSDARCVGLTKSGALLVIRDAPSV